MLAAELAAARADTGRRWRPPATLESTGEKLKGTPSMGPAMNLSDLGTPMRKMGHAASPGSSPPQVLHVHESRLIQHNLHRVPPSAQWTAQLKITAIVAALSSMNAFCFDGAPLIRAICDVLVSIIEASERSRAAYLVTTIVVEHLSCTSWSVSCVLHAW